MMDRNYVEDGQIDETEVTLVGHQFILPASYEEKEEWVKKYREQSGTDPSFF